MSLDSREELDTKERKRLQNRLAQRTYRQNQKQRIKALERAVGQSSHTRTSSSMSDTGIFVPSELGRDGQTWTLSVNDDLQPSPSFLQLDGHSPHSDVLVDKMLFDTPPDVFTLPGTRLNLGRTALHRAVCNGNESIIRILLDGGADIGRQDNNGQTALHFAVESGRESLVKLLLEKTDPNVKDAMGRTALFTAVESGNDIITKLLLDASIDVDCKDTLGETALYLAVENGSESSTLLLLKYGANINA